VDVAVCAELAIGLALVVTGGAAIAAGPWFVKYKANGTTMMPTMTVNTKVTAPHSRRRTDQFTSAEFYRRSEDDYSDDD
jgi:hypothetical protein